MRVAIITENFLPKVDGVTRTLARLLEHLQTSGHQALLLGPDSGMEQYAGAEIIGTVGWPFPFYPELKLNFFRPLFMRRLSEFRPDIVHLVDPVILGAAGLMVARVLDIPLVSSYHTNLAAYCEHFGFAFLTKPMWSHIRSIHNQCSLTFCPSLSTAAMLRKQGFHRLHIWSRGVDTTLFHPQRKSAQVRTRWLNEREQPDDKVVLLYAGRLSWEKNLRLLVQAYRSMDHQHCHLILVGDGPASATIQQELAGCPVTFTGFLSGEELATAYASADVFAFPSYTETFGQVVLEAMASGLPVVGLLSGGVCDLVDDGQTGLLLDRQRLCEEELVAGYHACLARLVHDHQLRTVMGQTAFMQAQHHSWAEAMEGLVQGYRAVIERRETAAVA